ncbi:uncharacterized protein DNG_07081 [Cephalotrichum gorgonifer]|uniref:Uncharacterized protein n=1 Tax=Cephalotrichum gorgonifer TaxID=2041049 RepID=A0AAE8SX23_9PEZI|nr:uncharacterized protein DNG_07081 [Cephalotrichum gorgonifer]
MAPSLMERIQAKIELFRLEQRYTRRRNRRSTFRSNAIYVDGEYVYQTPSSTGSSTESHASAPGMNALHYEAPVGAIESPSARKRALLGAATIQSPEMRYIRWAGGTRGRRVTDEN